jgi:hypothetical protein
MRVNLEGVVSSLEAARDQLEEQVTRLNGELAEARSDLKRVNAMLGLAAEPKKSRPKAKSNGNGSIVTEAQIEELKPIIAKMKDEFTRTDLINATREAGGPPTIAEKTIPQLRAMGLIRLAGQKRVGERGRKSMMYRAYRDHG